jgi:hypothetical protein
MVLQHFLVKNKKNDSTAYMENMSCISYLQRKKFYMHILTHHTRKYFVFSFLVFILSLNKPYRQTPSSPLPIQFPSEVIEPHAVWTLITKITLVINQ